MEIRKNNFNDPDRAEERDDERLEGFSASEMADRGPKDVLKDRSQYTDTGASSIRPVSNANGDEDDEEEEDDELIDNEEIDLGEDDFDEEDVDDEDLDDIEFEEDEEDDEDDNL